MVTVMHSEDEEDWDAVDDEYDSADDETEPTQLCPACNHEMLEIAIQCPRCGTWVSKEEHFERSQPRWVVLTVFLCLALVLLWFLF
jgi:uncharacterized paraquat-inducible protein A